MVHVCQRRAGNSVPPNLTDRKGLVMSIWIGERPSKVETEGFFARYWSGTIGRGLTDAQREERARAEHEFAASKPPLTQSCIACGKSCDWIVADSLEGRQWVCQGCHRPSTLTMEEWSAELEQKRKDEAEKAAEIASRSTAPATRTALKEALAKHGRAELVARKMTAAVEDAAQ